MNAETFEQLIKLKFSSLSIGQKKVAEYLIEQLDEVAISTAVQIGRKVGVSETTVIRLSYALGFKGFSEMQERIQKQVFLQGSPIQIPRQSNEEDDEQDPFVRLIENDIRILRQTLHPKNIESLWRAVDEMIKADQILLVGNRSSYAAAYWFYYMLSTLRPGVRLCPHTGEAYETLCDLTQSSVVFVISFPRYVKDTVQIAQSAKQMGMTVISATDRLLSPVGEISDITLTTEEGVESGSNSIAPVISLLDLIFMGMNGRNKEQIQQRQEKLEQLYSANQVYVE